MICDEVTDEITDVVYLPGNPYTVASHISLLVVLSF